jgi:alpha-tubulin suppressor-like RCC1 family protein
MKRICLMSLIAFSLVLAACGGSGSSNATDDAVSLTPGASNDANDNGGDSNSGSNEIGAPTVAAGARHSCAVEDGKVLCWGSNKSGQLGDGTTTDSVKPVEVQGISAATTIAATTEATCAVHQGGAVSCWGASARESYGADKGNSPTPAPVTGIANAVRISIGPYNGCAATDAGTVLCWGKAFRGVLGGGDAAAGNDNTVAATPVQAVGVSDAVDVAVENVRSCAVLGSGKVMCWGNNEYDTLGTGTTDKFSATPQPVLGLDDVVTMSTTGAYSCAVISDGSLKCWGERRSNVFSALPASTDLTTPTAIPNVDDAVAVATSDSRICIIDRGGDVWCWGSGQYGQLGNGDASLLESDTPVQVKGISHAVSLAAGSFHSCAMTSSGTVSCWGNNPTGQTGQTPRTDSAEAVSVAGVG